MKYLLRLFLISALLTAAPPASLGILPAHATGGGDGGGPGGGGEGGGVNPFDRRDQSNDPVLRRTDKIHAEIREIATLIVAAGNALKEANQAIKILEAVNREKDFVGGLTNSQRSQLNEEINRQIAEQQSMIYKIKRTIAIANRELADYLAKIGQPSAKNELARIQRNEEARQGQFQSAADSYNGFLQFFRLR